MSESESESEGGQCEMGTLAAARRMPGRPSSLSRVTGGFYPAVAKSWIPAAKDAFQGSRRMSSLTFDSVVKTQSNVADICAEIKLLKECVVAQKPDSMNDLLTRAAKTMQEQQSLVWRLEGEKLALEREKAEKVAAVEREKAERADKVAAVEREKATIVEAMGEALRKLEKEKGDEHEQCVLFKQQLREAEKDLLRAKRLLTSRGVVERILELFYRFLLLQKDKFVGQQLENEYKRLVPTKFNATAVCNCIEFFVGRVDGFPGDAEKVLLQAFQRMKDAHPQSPWSKDVRTAFQKLYSILSQEIHGEPWSGSSVSFRRN